MTQTIAIRISEPTLPLITLLNGGVEPWITPDVSYYVCDIEGTETINHKIISGEEYRTTAARYASSFDINHWTK